MSCCRETVEMAVIPGNRAAAPRDWIRGVLEQYVAGGACPEPVLSLSKEHPRTPGRTVRHTVAVTPRRDEISGLHKRGESI
jgi:hypothetical protein